jgi:glycosyltransferase involved in cell wall biosynthesis
MKRSVLHVLPHPGGGAETYLALLDDLDGYEHRRVTLAASRSRGRGAVTVPMRLPGIVREARDADILHVHGDTAAILSLPVLRGRPSAITTHGLHRLRRAGRIGGPLARRGMRYAIAAAGATICTSDAERAELAVLVGPVLEANLVVVPNGVPVPPPLDPEKREMARARLRLGQDEIVGLFIGRLEPRKEPLLAAEAADRARSADIDVVLLMAGDGPLAKAVKEAAGPAVRPLGFYRDVELLYAAADFFVLPSRREGMSIALLEAMAHGVPALVARAPETVEAIGDAGLLVAPDPDALAGGIGRLADPELRRSLSRAGRGRIADELSVARFLERTAAVYGRVLEDRPSAAVVREPDPGGDEPLA